MSILYTVQNLNLRWHHSHSNTPQYLCLNMSGYNGLPTLFPISWASIDQIRQVTLHHKFTMSHHSTTRLNWDYPAILRPYHSHVFNKLYIEPYFKLCNSYPSSKSFHWDLHIQLHTSLYIPRHDPSIAFPIPLQIVAVNYRPCRSAGPYLAIHKASFILHSVVLAIFQSIPTMQPKSLNPVTRCTLCCRRL